MAEIYRIGSDDIVDRVSEFGGTNLLIGTQIQDTSKGNYRNSVTATSTTFKGCTVFTSTVA